MRIRAIMARNVALIAGFFLIASQAQANPTAYAKYKDWSVFISETAGDRVCYAVTEATEKAPGSARHGDVFFYVSQRPKSGVLFQPSLKVGFDLHEDLTGLVSIGRSKWTLFSSGNEAFVRDTDDAGLIRQLERGSKLRVEAVSQRNTQVTYHFSLAGSSNAIEKAAQACS